MSVKLISVGVSFAGACAEIHEQCFEDKHSWSKTAFVSLFKMGAKAWIAFLEEDPVGLVVSRDTAGEGELLTICVLEEARRRGVGETLLDRVCQTHPILFLEVETTNKAAVELYKKFGFQECGLRKDYYAKGRNAFVMTRTTN